MGIVVPSIYALGASALFGNQYLIASVLFFLSLAVLCIKICTWEEARPYSRRRVLLTTIFVTLLVFAASEEWVVHSSSEHRKSLNVPAVGPTQPIEPVSKKLPSSASSRRSMTLQQLFEKAPERGIRLGMGHAFPNTVKGKDTVLVSGAITVDTVTQTYFVSFYIPPTKRLLSICQQLANRDSDPWQSLQAYLKENDAGKLIEHPILPTQMMINHPTFSGRVFLYHEDPLTLSERARIETAFERSRLSVDFKGQQDVINELYLGMAADGAK